MDFHCHRHFCWMSWTIWSCNICCTTTHQRNRDQEVLGASVNGLVFLLSKEFLRLVIIALLIASPIAWFFMNNWLQDFAYRINIRWWIFGAAALVAITIAMLTVSVQAIKAAIANPVKSLRSE